MMPITRALPTWPGLNMDRQVRKMVNGSRKRSSEMVTVMAARILEERSAKRDAKR